MASLTLLILKRIFKAFSYTYIGYGCQESDPEPSTEFSSSMWGSNERRGKSCLCHPC